MSKAPARKVKPGDHVFLVDGSSYIFRAYHALPPLTRKSDSLPVGAVAGFCNMLWKLLVDADAGVKPTHIAVVFDKSEHTFRNELYDQYKAHRAEAPEDLVPQFGLIRAAVKAFNVASIEQGGFEADDLIATYAREAVAAGADVTIVASDKDLMQLVNPLVTMFDTMKDKRIGEAEVAERFGVPPAKVIDVQALAASAGSGSSSLAVARRNTINASPVSTAAATKGAPGKYTGPPAAVKWANNWVMNGGLRMAVRLAMLARPPCSSPCSLAGTFTDMIPCMAGVAKPCRAPTHTNR
jgi:hypothetical protein